MNENSESRLEDRVRHILHEDLNLQYDEIMAAVTQQVIIGLNILKQIYP